MECWYISTLSLIKSVVWLVVKTLRSKHWSFGDSEKLPKYWYLKLLETIQMNLHWKIINYKNTSIECILSSTINGLQPKKLKRPKKTMAKINLCWKILISEWYQKFFKWSNFLRHFSVEDKFKNERFHCFFNYFYWESKERHFKSPKRFFRYSTVPNNCTCTIIYFVPRMARKWPKSCNFI